MKLAIVRQQYRPDGGAEQFISRALKGLAHKNCLDISVIARNWQGEIPESIQLLTCDPAFKGRIARESSFAQQARELWQTQPFDLIQSHERIPGCSIYRAGDGVHKVWLEQRKRILSKLSAWWLTRSRYHQYVLEAEKAMFEHPKLKAVICNAQMVKNEICESFQIDPSKIHVIYNGVDSETFKPCTVEQKALLRTQLGFKDKPTFLYVGSGYERKGVTSIIRAFADLSEDSQLVLVGKEKKLQKYKKLAQKLNCSERVIFAGMQANVLEYYQAADALIHPALYDPFPNVILEAMACALPVITSEKCGGSEFIKADKNGYVADALDLKTLTNCMHRLLDCEHRLTMGRNARLTVQPYSIEQCAAALTDLYSSLTEEGKY